VGGCGSDSSDSGQGVVAGNCEPKQQKMSWLAEHTISFSRRASCSSDNDTYSVLHTRVLITNLAKFVYHVYL
jgi:hypothetical protein